MNERRERQRAALQTVLKKETHELVAARRELAAALEVLRKHESGLERASAEVAAAEAGIRALATAGAGLELGAFETWRRYLASARAGVRAAEASRARSENDVERISRDVAGRRAHSRAIERVSDRLLRAQTVESERSLDHALEDAWSQRRHREHDEHER